MKVYPILAALALTGAVLFLLLREQPAPLYCAANFPAAVAIAPLHEALTFARTEVDGEVNVLAVVAYEGEYATAVNLTRALGGPSDDPVDLFNQLGYDRLQELIESEAKRATESVEIAKLIVPLELADAHVAAGTNFAAHAEESAVEDGPFLFAKLVTPTPSGSAVSAGDALLDYEVELSFVTLMDVPLPNVPEHMGLILSNDVTDRATLLRLVNPDDVTSGDGFTTGKSGEGYLPVGDLFVIPRNLRKFVESIEIRLAVNGQLRQSAPMTLAIWDIDEMLHQIEIRESSRWDHRGAEVGLPVRDGVLAKRTLILSGTPEGTAFSGVSKRTMALGILDWVAGGWKESVPHHVVERYIAQAREGKTFLQPGDRIEIHVDRMGVLKTLVQE